MLGREILLPLDIVLNTKTPLKSQNKYINDLISKIKYVHQKAYQNMNTKLKKIKHRYHKNIYGIPYNVGDKVWYKIPVRNSKLDPYFYKPYIITHKYSDSVYQIKNGNG